MSSKYQFTSFDIAKKSLSHFHKACWYFSISSEVHWSVSDKEITGNSKTKLNSRFTFTVHAEYPSIETYIVIALEKQQF